MATRGETDPSPLRSGFVHACLSLATFSGLAGALGVGVHLTGDPLVAGPREHLALFDTVETAAPALKTRLKAETAGGLPQDQAVVEFAEEGSGDMGDDVQEFEIAAAGAETAQGGPSDEESDASEGVRINGKLVRPGESYGQVTQVIALGPSRVSAVSERVNGAYLPRVGVDGRAPADVYARPFSNPNNQPMVSLVVGGLGINATHTRSAIEELPPEVTLSFAPDARSLQYWINSAREHGHEVLLEVPMEAYEYGRMKMHPLTLMAGDKSSVNESRLTRLLGRASGYFGVISYQGAKFADDPAATGAVLETLGERGVAFLTDGSLPETAFVDVAGQTNVRFARADAPVDATVSADEINAEFMELETAALKQGASMGAGYAFPLTIELAKEWTAGLEAKGILLAPASALAETQIQNPDEARLQTGSLTSGPVSPKG